MEAEKKIEDMSVLELKGVLFDMDAQITVINQQKQKIMEIANKKVQEEQKEKAKEEAKKVEENKEDSKEKGK